VNEPKMLACGMCWRRSLLYAGALLLLSATTVGCRRQGQTPELKPLETKPAPKVSLEQASGALNGHQITVRCLRGERAMTDGDELRCEDWTYVLDNYR